MDPRARGQRRPEVPLRAPLPRLFWVTNDSVLADRGFVERAGAAMRAVGPGSAVQLRGHGLAGRRFWELAAELSGLARETGAGLWINDRIDVAMAVRADGVQLGGRGLPIGVARSLLGLSCPVGCSVHGRGEVESCFAEGADLAVLGSVFPTSSHPGRAPLGLEPLGASAAAGRPIVAIGGISPDRVKEIIAAGAWGVAVLSGVWMAADPAASASRYASALRDALQDEAAREH